MKKERKTKEKYIMIPQY